MQKKRKKWGVTPPIFSVHRGWGLKKRSARKLFCCGAISHLEAIWRLAGDSLGDSLETLWRLCGDSLKTLWRLSGSLQTLWRLSEDAPETLWRLSGDSLGLCRICL